MGPNRIKKGRLSIYPSHSSFGHVSGSQDSQRHLQLCSACTPPYSSTLVHVRRFEARCVAITDRTASGEWQDGMEKQNKRNAALPWLVFVPALHASAVLTSFFRRMTCTVLAFPLCFRFYIHSGVVISPVHLGRRLYTVMVPCCSGLGQS